MIAAIFACVMLAAILSALGLLCIRFGRYLVAEKFFVRSSIFTLISATIFIAHLCTR